MVIDKLITKALLMTNVLLLCAGQVQANQQSEEQQLRSLLTKYDGFQANFAQTVVDSDNNLLHQANGSLGFEQPGKFVWQISDPEPEQLISDGVTLWWYNPFIEQVSLFDAAQAVEQTPFALLVSQDNAVWSQFLIKKKDDGFVITPKSMDQAQVVELKVSFNQDVLNHIKVVGRTMQISHYQLSAPKFGDIDDSAFVFTIPAGTDIDDQRSVIETVDGNVKY